MQRHTVIPYDNRAGLPLDAGLQVTRVREVVVQELEQSVGFLLLQAHDIAGELRVDVQRLLAGGGMGADDGVLVHDGFPPLDGATCYGGVDLFDSAVCGLETVETLLEQGRETVVGFDGVGEEGVAAAGWALKEDQEGGSGRLGLVGDIGVMGN